MPSDALSGISSFMSSGGLLIILMIGMFALMIIPQRKREKKIKDMLAAIKVFTAPSAPCGTISSP